MKKTKRLGTFGRTPYPQPSASKRRECYTRAFFAATRGASCPEGFATMSPGDDYLPPCDGPQPSPMLVEPPSLEQQSDLSNDGENSEDYNTRSQPIPHSSFKHVTERQLRFMPISSREASPSSSEEREDEINFRSTSQYY